MKLAITVSLLALVTVLSLSLYKIDSDKESYCVDISGGFKPDCDCPGYSAVNS